MVIWDVQMENMILNAKLDAKLDIEAIYRKLEADLTRPRRINEQVESGINSQYSYMAEQFGEFLSEKYPKLEDYEIDLVFSPLFTPLAAEQRVYMPLLGSQHLSAEQMRALKDQLETAQLMARFENLSGQVFEAPLHPVNLDRYVSRLLLDKPIDSRVYQVITDTVTDEPARLETLRVARDPVWQGEGRSAILSAFLKVFHQQLNFNTAKLNYLTDVMRTYRPTSFADIERQLEAVIDSCAKDLENVGNRIVIDPQLQAAYSDSELAHLQHDRTHNHYRHLMDLAQQLKDDYLALVQKFPDEAKKLSGLKV